MQLCSWIFCGKRSVKPQKSQRKSCRSCWLCYKPGLVPIYFFNSIGNVKQIAEDTKNKKPYSNGLNCSSVETTLKYILSPLSDVQDPNLKPSTGIKSLAKPSNEISAKITPKNLKINVITFIFATRLRPYNSMIKGNKSLLSIL